MPTASSREFASPGDGINSFAAIDPRDTDAAPIFAMQSSGNVAPVAMVQGSSSDGQAGNNALQVGVIVKTGTTWDYERRGGLILPINAVTVTSETTLLTPTAGRKWRLMGGLLVGSAAGNILLRDNTAGTIILVIPTAAGGQGTHFQLGNGKVSAALNNVLTGQLSVAGTISGFLIYNEEV